MANANVEQNTKSESMYEKLKPGRKEPSVLKGTTYKIGEGEPDFVD